MASIATIIPILAIKPEIFPHISSYIAIFPYISIYFFHIFPYIKLQKIPDVARYPESTRTLPGRGFPRRRRQLIVDGRALGEAQVLRDA